MTFTHDDYKVAWICALPLEMAAAKAMLDEVHPSLPQPYSDHNSYTLGSISSHNVVVACPPSGVYGTISATAVLSHMQFTFPSLRFGLLVGIGGGVPSEKTDIRLGDVAVSKPTASSGGVIQYDYGKTLHYGRFQSTGSLNTPPLILLTAVSQIRSNYMIGERPITEILSNALQKHQGIREQFSRPDKDWLFSSGYNHQSSNPDCSTCDQTQLVNRAPRVTEEPHIHYGLIASGNQVMRDAKTRDSIAQEMGILCFDIEAAGLMDQLPCLIIRGICDYCDSHKQKRWQGYAALTAAAYTKILLSIVPAAKRELSEAEKECLRSLSFREQEAGYHEIQLAINTCTWLLEDLQYKEWLNSPRGLLWIKGDPGTGKSVLMKFAIRSMADRKTEELVVSFFMNGQGAYLQRTPLGLFRALLNCMLDSFPGYLSELTQVFIDRGKRFGPYEEGKWAWMEGELEQLMSQMLTEGTMSRPVLLFVDGLDECGTDCAKNLLTYFDRLMEEVKRKGGRVKICLSCRHYPSFRRHTNHSIFMEQQNTKDIQRVVADLLKEIKPEKDRKHLEKEILLRAHGDFRWVILVCNSMTEKYTRGENLRELLLTMQEPDVLEEIIGESAEIHANQQFPFDDITAPEQGETFLSIKDSGYSSLPTQDSKGPLQTTEVNMDQGFHSGDVDVNDRSLLYDDDQTIDGVSIYTAGPDTQAPKQEAYIFSFADDLLNKALTVKPDQGSLDRIYGALPELLKAFAMKVGSSDSMQIYRDVMAFVRKHRIEIARTMRDKYIEENSIRSDVLGNNTVNMDLDDPVSNWSLDLDTLEDPNTALNEKPDDTMDDSHYEELDEGDRAADSLPEVSAYKAFISGLPAYKWLLESIRKVLYMGVPGNVQTNIKEQILEYLPKAQRVSRREAPQRHSLTFTAEWDPCSFLREQEYLESPERAMERAITVTGSEMDAQAATTTQYIFQTWPSSGMHLLHVVKSVVRDILILPYSYNLPDGTQLIAWSRGPVFKLEVIGIAESIAEIGEQLAWLGSALRSSPYEKGVTVVNAFVSGIWTNESTALTEELTSKMSCNISFNLDVIDDSDEISNGQCWHQLFRNPVIVRGYPIPRRPISNMGLEISLDTMAGLTETHYINIFNKKIFIKGFSTMLIPTRHSDNILLWHLLYKKNGDRISYLESKGYHAEDISLSDLETSRHILGWSSKVRYLAGTADANYVIDRSWLRGLHDNCRLKGISVSQGRLIKSDHTAAYGKKDKPPQISRGTYREKLHALSKKYVVLWDVGCKRGWLLNGTNALLHLLRASLEFNKTDDLSFAFLFKPEKFKEATNPHTISAAMEVLMNPANLNMELYEESEQDESNAGVKFRVRDRVNELYGTLEKIIDYQIMITGEEGEGFKIAPRKDLEGWDFKDIATNEDPTYPCLAKLKTIGKGWVDFTRAIQAVSLFGRGFGDLIDPIAKSDTCIHWETLPSNKYYLAASMEDISRIMDRLGHPRANPPRLTKSIVWYPFKMTSIPRCDCSRDTEKQCEFAQAIWPLHMGQRLPKNSSLPLKDVGAVVFGHNTGIGWIWNDIGDPEEGQAPLSDEESDDDDPADSGIGLSVGSSNILASQGSPPARANIHALEHENYKVAIICALSKELMAVRALFDDSHQHLLQHENDTNTYALGRLGTHNVVAACLPCAEYGMNAASKVASDMEKTFPAVKWYFVVGIGGGIPSEKHDIRLGDVVVSTGVIQHDMGKMIQKDSMFQSTGILRLPARPLMTAISSIQSDPRLQHDFLETHIQRIVSLRPEYRSPGEDHDKLFQPNSRHKDGQETCRKCKGPEVPKRPRPPGPHIHYGRIASGNQVIKDAIIRDCIGAEMNVLCVEMEGAGVMTTGHCLVIRGICDYADSHKNDEWHNYAAATAAAYTKFFLLRMRSLDMMNREVVHIQKRPGSILVEDELLSKRSRYD